MKEIQLNSLIDRKVIWQEIKALEREFKRNQMLIKSLTTDNDKLVVTLGEKLAKIQELAEQFDSVF